MKGGAAYRCAGGRGGGGGRSPAGGAGAGAGGGAGAPAPGGADAGDQVRFATFNASLNRGTAGMLRADLSYPDNAQARTIAEIVQRTRPDVLLINDFDFDPVAAELFQTNYLSIGQ